jgi:hypothetical protein
MKSTMLTDMTPRSLLELSDVSAQLVASAFRESSWPEASSELGGLQFRGDRFPASGLKIRGGQASS